MVENSFLCQGESRKPCLPQIQPCREFFSLKVIMIDHLEMKLSRMSSAHCVHRYIGKGGANEWCMRKCFQLKHRRCLFTPLWSCHLTRDIGHIAVSTSPARGTDTSSLGSSLDTCAFILTGRFAAQIHKCLERKQNKNKNKPTTWYMASTAGNTTQSASSRSKERKLCKTGSMWRWKERDSTSQV